MKKNLIISSGFVFCDSPKTILKKSISHPFFLLEKIKVGKASTMKKFKNKWKKKNPGHYKNLHHKRKNEISSQAKETVYFRHKVDSLEIPQFKVDKKCPLEPFFAYNSCKPRQNFSIMAAIFAEKFKQNSNFLWLKK